MWSHLLVPLDGSPLAEAALPVAAMLARRLPARVTLLHLIERDPPAAVHGQPHLTEAGAAAAYLQQVAARVFPGAANVTCHVDLTPETRVPAGILAHEAELASDLVVMCTHGRAGLRDLVSGNIAQQLIAGGTTPVLLVHPHGEATTDPETWRRFLVPLDGDPVHEPALTLATDLAAVLRADLKLLAVVPTWGALAGPQATARRFMPGAMQELLDCTEDELRCYLTRKCQDLRARQLTATGEVVRGDPVEAILAAALQADLIVLGTHGKAGTQAFWSGSVGPRIVTGSRVPVLIVPLPAP